MHRLLIPRLLLPVALAGCAAPAGPRLLYTPDDSVRPVTHVESVREYDVAIASIASVLERDAVGGYRRVLLNEAAIARQEWPARVASLAHELGHSLQYELGGGTQ
ncbi:MAG: hypothetical protein HYU53_05360 [Acidobacteria bacterium]|nr:hypothetical protein [Acidobacteriota bacterium]